VDTRAHGGLVWGIYIVHGNMYDYLKRLQGKQFSNIMRVGEGDGEQIFWAISGIRSFAGCLHGSDSSSAVLAADLSIDDRTGHMHIYGVCVCARAQCAVGGISQIIRWKGSSLN
jgi:hypothetical protein